MAAWLIFIWIAVGAIVGFLVSNNLKDKTKQRLKNDIFLGGLGGVLGGYSIKYLTAMEGQNVLILTLVSATIMAFFFVLIARSYRK